MPIRITCSSFLWPKTSVWGNDWKCCIADHKRNINFSAKIIEWKLAIIKSKYGTIKKFSDALDISLG